MLLDAAALPDWAQHLPGAGLIATAFLFAPFITKILTAWWSRKKNGDEKPNENGESPPPARRLDRMEAKVDDLVGRFRDHAERDVEDSKEVRDAVGKTNDALQRIEVAITAVVTRLQGR